MNFKIKHLILAFFSLILMGAYVFYIPNPVQNSEELKKVKFGFPMAFVEQDMSCQNSFSFYPNYFRFAPKLYKDCSIKNFSPVSLALSFLITFLILEAAIYFLEILNFYVRKIFPRSKTEKNQNEF